MTVWAQSRGGAGRPGRKFKQYFMEPKKQKRPRDEDNDDDEIIAWPRFVVISAADESIPLRLSPFAIQKGIEGLAGNPKSVKKLRSGDLLIETNRKSHSDNLLKSTTLAGVPIVCTPHRTLNTSKGIMRCPDLRDCGIDEIKEELKNQGVCEAKRITFKRDGAEIRTNTFVLTFNSTSLPQALKIGYLRCKVEQYIPNPLRCFKCQKYGHSKATCRGKEICPKCGLEDHDDTNCTNPEKCVNCGGGHPSYAKNCPKWVQEKEIQKVKVTRHVSYVEARKLVEINTKPTYATVTQTKTTSTSSTQTDLSFSPDQEISITVKPKIPIKPAKNKNKSRNTNEISNVTDQKREPGTVTDKSKSRNSDQSPDVTDQKRKPGSVTEEIKTTNTQKNKPKIQTKRPVLNRPTNRKGTDDPIQTYNKYGALDDMDSEDFEIASEDLPCIKPQ